MEADEGVMVNVGSGLTVTTTVPEFIQPFELIPVTVYVMVRVGVAVTVAPVVALRFVFGAHV
jgi:hypothetical protein